VMARRKNNPFLRITVDIRSEVFKVVKTHLEVFLVMTLCCSPVGRYQCFGLTYYLFHEGRAKVAAVYTSRTSVTTYQPKQYHCQKATVCIKIVVSYEYLSLSHLPPNIYFFFSMALQLFGPWPLFSVYCSIHRR
jgi:hypothetical protein